MLYKFLAAAVILGTTSFPASASMCEDLHQESLQLGALLAEAQLELSKLALQHSEVVLGKGVSSPESCDMISNIMEDFSGLESVSDDYLGLVSLIERKCTEIDTKQYSKAFSAAYKNMGHYKSEAVPYYEKLASDC